MAVATLILFICCIASKMTIYYIAPNSDFTEDELLTFTKCQMANTIMASKIQVSNVMDEELKGHLGLQLFTGFPMVCVRILPLGTQSNGTLFRRPTSTTTLSKTPTQAIRNS